MNELLQFAVAHHLYIILPMVLGVWIWSNWGDGTSGGRCGASSGRWRGSGPRVRPTYQGALTQTLKAGANCLICVVS